MGGRTALLVGMVCAVLAGPAATAATAQSSPHDFAVGSAKNMIAEFTPFPFQLEVSAHKQSDADVTGHVRGSGELPVLGGFRVEGEVTCLRVEPKPAFDPTGPGIRASIKYRFKHSSGPTAPPQNGGVEVFIEDNGNPVDGQPVDGNGTEPPMTAEAFEASDPESCDDPNVFGQPYNPIDSGNYVVHNGTVP